LQRCARDGHDDALDRQLVGTCVHAAGGYGAARTRTRDASISQDWDRRKGRDSLWCAERGRFCDLSWMRKRAARFPAFVESVGPGQGPLSHAVCRMFAARALHHCTHQYHPSAAAELRRLRRRRPTTSPLPPTGEAPRVATPLAKPSATPTKPRPVHLPAGSGCVMLRAPARASCTRDCGHVGRTVPESTLKLGQSGRGYATHKGSPIVLYVGPVGGLAPALPGRSAA
jgi:hypothetical protein